jgi:hypothetical protein
VLAAHTGWWNLYQARTCRIFKKRVFRARFQEKRFEYERPHTCFTLRGLERDGLVTRTVFPTTPQRVDYELTKLGSTLQPAIAYCFGSDPSDPYQSGMTKTAIGAPDNHAMAGECEHLPRLPLAILRRMLAFCLWHGDSAGRLRCWRRRQRSRRQRHRSTHWRGSRPRRRR